MVSFDFSEYHNTRHQADHVKYILQVFLSVNIRFGCRCWSVAKWSLWLSMVVDSFFIPSGYAIQETLFVMPEKQHFTYAKSVFNISQFRIQFSQFLHHIQRFWTIRNKLLSHFLCKRIFFSFETHFSSIILFRLFVHLRPSTAFFDFHVKLFLSFWKDSKQPFWIIDVPQLKNSLNYESKSKVLANDSYSAKNLTLSHKKKMI